VRSGPVDAAPDHQGLAHGIDEVHALRGRARGPGDPVRQADRLEDAHDLAVEMHGARQRENIVLPVEDIDRDSKLPQQVRQQRADGPAADDSDVASSDGGDVAQEFSAFQTRSGVAGMSIGFPPSASTMAFITDGREPAQPASPHPLAPSTLVFAGTE